MAQAIATSLFEELGGAPAVCSVVEDFYRRVLADHELKGFFAGVDMDVQTRRQIKFLTQVLGGPSGYDGRSMHDAHEGLGITEHHFGLVAGQLVDTLKGAGVGQDTIDDVVALVGPLKGDIVTA